MLLVPHMCSHPNDKSISFVHIVATINKIQVISYFRSKETVNEFSKSYAKENKIQHRQLNRDIHTMSTLYQESQQYDSEPDSPSSPFWKMSKIGANGNSIGDSPQRKKEHKQCASGFKYSLTITTIQPVNIYKKVLQQCQGQPLDKTNCNMLNAYFMIKKYSNLFDCSTDVSIQLYARLSIQKRKNDVLIRLRMQARYIDNYKHAVERKISQMRDKGVQREGQFEPLPADKAHLEEKRQELYQFLLKNNEQTRGYHQEYKLD